MLTTQASDDFDPTKLMSLQPARHLELLDVVDKLRAQGLNEHIDLPQLIVCGDQSSGKSSVLAAISGVPFPKKDNLCTRFATEVVLRRDDELQENKITVKIMPSSTRPSTERLALDSFTRKLSSINDLPSTIVDATFAMGLGVTGNAFSADILRLEVRGPQMPQLTIVDLPGLVHAENKFQSADDIALVNALVEEYMSQERSIILAVVSAKNDYANQIVLTKARKVDPDGLRTLGIITKPDTLHPESASETSFLGLAQNHDIKFSLGWHIVRNQDSNRVAENDQDNLEYEFFNASRFGRLNQKFRGIDSLRERLSEVLFHQIQRELPDLISEILVATDDTKTRLTRMGRSRATPIEKRIFVMELGQKFSSLCFAACEGLYESSFFEEFGQSTLKRRLRAVVQNANIDFATELLNAPLQIHVDNYKSDHVSPTVAQRAKELVQSYRGKELPGTFNPILVGQLFRELSRAWFDRAREHISNIWLHARTTVIAILDEVAEDYVRDVCVREVIDPIMEQIQKEMESRLSDYMLAFHRQPITYNHYLTETVQAARNKRYYDAARAKCQQLFATRDRLSSNDIDLIARTVTQFSEPDMDAMAAQNLDDYTEAYYKVALKRVIDEIPSHVIEPSIMNRLPAILDSSRILGMSEELIDSIGSESEARKALRGLLQAKLDVFSRSSLICKAYSDTTALVNAGHRVPALRETETSNVVRTSEDDTVKLDTIEDSPVAHEAALDGVVAMDDDWGLSTVSTKKKGKKVSKAKSYFESSPEDAR